LYPINVQEIHQSSIVIILNSGQLRPDEFLNITGRERERGIKTKMRVKLAVKMLVIAWTLMKKREVFDPVYLNIE